MKEHELQLADAKTKIALLTKKIIPTIIPMRMRGSKIIKTHAVKFLRMMLDRQ